MAVSSRWFLAIVLTVLGCLQSPSPAWSQGSPPAGGSLQKLVAPIALYPDPLVAQILPASTNPIEIVEAYRVVADGGRPDSGAHAADRGAHPQRLGTARGGRPLNGGRTMLVRRKFGGMDESGGALLLSVVTLVSVAGLSSALLMVAGSRQKENVAAVEQSKALYLAEAGMSASIAAVTHGTAGAFGSRNIE